MNSVPVVGSINSSETNKVEVLLVDDREDNLLALEATLSSPDYVLIKARSGDEALRYLLNHEPGLILMDVQMPGLDGFETARLIKQNEKSRDIPIIFVTAINKEERYVFKGYRRGAVDYIAKPFDPDILRSKVAVFADLDRKTKSLIEKERALRQAEVRERERQLAELELRALKRDQAEKKRYLDLVEGIDHAIVWSANPVTLAFSFVSRSAETILRYPLIKWRSEPHFFQNHLHHEDRDRVLSAIKMAGSGLPMSVEHRFIRGDGTIAWLKTDMKFGRKGDSDESEVKALSVDVSGLKEAEAKLRKLKDEQTFLAEAGLAFSSSLDRKEILKIAGTLLTTMAAETVFLGTECEFLSGAPIRGPLSAEDLEIRLRQASSDRTENFELPGYGPCIAAPLVCRGIQKGHLCLLGIDNLENTVVEDLSSRLAMALDNADLYLQAKEAVRARDEFLSIASHELKTPLTPIKLQIQSISRMLKDKTVTEISEEKLRKGLATSDQQVLKLTRLIDELLDLSRIRTGRLNLIPENFDLVVLIQEVIERYREQAQAVGTAFHFDPPGEIRVNLDRFRMEQVIVNLVTNALKYGAGKPVTLRLSSLSHGAVRLDVVDQGIGIPKKDHQRIFERFERAVGENQYGGLGLGLYIVNQILKLHGGTIEVRSEEGRGSEFRLEIPRSVASTGLQTSSPARRMAPISREASLPK